MEPSAEELNQIDTIAAAYDWAGVPEDVRASLGQALGAPTKIRDIIFVGRTVWDTTVGRIKGLDPPDADGNQAQRDLTPVDVSRLEIFRRVCFRRVGAQPDTPGTLGPPAPAVTAAPPAQIATPPTGRKLKMSAVVDQTLDAEVIPLSTEEINRMYETYKNKFGDVPSPDSEPTGDQLSAVSQLVSSGGTPYIDFAVYGPHGLRLLRKMTFQSIALNSMGEWQRREMPGPPDHESWFEIFRCLRTTFLLLETLSAERMDAYAEHIRQLSQRFGRHCWDLVYTADVHMRSEQFDRIRRRLHAAPDHGYTEASPWNAVMAQAVREDAFWTREVITPATLRLAQSKAIPAPLSSPEKPGALAEASGHQPGAKRQKKRKTREAEDKSKHDGKVFTHNRRGMEICANWNQNRCGKTDRPQSVCERHRSHQCNLCLGPHQGLSCTKAK